MQAYFATAVVVFRIPGTAAWPYFARLALLALGLPIVIKNELSQAHRLDKFMPLGIGNGLNYLVDTSLFRGAAFILADALPEGDHRHVRTHRKEART